MVEELKADMEKVRKIMYEQNRNINQEAENIKGNKKYILELKSTIIEKKNSLEGFKGKFEQGEERLGEDMTVEMIKPKEQKE